MVTSRVPGDRGVPCSRNAAEPCCWMKGRLARVSTLLTRVGRPATPDSNGRGGLSVGLTGPPLSARTAAVSSPAPYPGSTTRTAAMDAAERPGPEFAERGLHAASRLRVGHVDVGTVGRHDCRR